MTGMRGGERPKSPNHRFFTPGVFELNLNVTTSTSPVHSYRVRAMTEKRARQFLVAMVAYWLVFGLITVLDPALMDLFQTPAGVGAKTAFSSHVWMHGGFDILSVCVLVFAISRGPLSPARLRAVGVAALMPTMAIAWSLLATPYWSPLFIVAGAGCLAFAAGAFVIAGRLV
jgi:hypothetical protein